MLSDMDAYRSSKDGIVFSVSQVLANYFCIIGCLRRFCSFRMLYECIHAAEYCLLLVNIVSILTILIFVSRMVELIQPPEVLVTSPILVGRWL